MRFSDPIYPITDAVLSGLSHTAQVERLIGTGVRLIQLREKHMPAREFAEDARTAIGIAKNAGITIIINDRVDIALALGADGVHLGQTDLLPEQARQVLGKDAIIGYSTHGVEQAVSAVRFPIDYIAAGPVFPTDTKEDPDEIIGLETLIEIRKIAKSLPVVAIGGIAPSNIASVSGTGVAAAALIGAISTPKNSIETAVNLLREQWNSNVV